MRGCKRIGEKTLYARGIAPECQKKKSACQGQIF
jgi:hypothetical protein